MTGKVEWITVWIVATMAGNYAKLAAPETLPGEPGKDYPIYADIPETAFSCQKQPFQGYYADVSTGCQVYHLCGEGGNQTSFLCPNGTVFNQATQQCDEWFNVDCKMSPQLFWRNKYYNATAKRDESNSEEDDSTVKDDGKASRVNENNISQIIDSLSLTKIQDLIDSEIKSVLYNKLPERTTNSSTSPDIETHFQKLKESLNEGNLTQFKKSLNAMISSRLEAMRASMPLVRTSVNAESRQKDSRKNAETAKHIFLLLSYLDKIKSTLIDDRAKSSIFPRFGEKLFKILSTLQEKRNTYKHSRVIENLNSRLDLVTDIDFFDSYKYYDNNNVLNKDTNDFNEFDNANLALNGNMYPLKLGSAFDKDINNSTEGKTHHISDEAAIELIQRILETAKINVSPPADEKVDIIATVNETSLVQEPPTNGSSVVDDSALFGSYHKSINDIIDSYVNGENSTKSDEESIKTDHERNITANKSNMSGEILTSKENSEENFNTTNDSKENSEGKVNTTNDSKENSEGKFNTTNDSDEYSGSDEFIEDVSNKNSSSKNESRIESELVNDTHIVDLGEILKSVKSNEENVSSNDVLDENSDEENDIFNFDTFGQDWSSGEIPKIDLNQNSSSVKNTSNEENLELHGNKTDVFNGTLNTESKGIDIIDSVDNSTSAYINETDTNINNITDKNVDKVETIVDNTYINDPDKYIRIMMSQLNNNSSDTSNEGLGVTINESQVKDDKNQTTTENGSANDEHHYDELMGILKGIYGTIGGKQEYN